MSFKDMLRESGASVIDYSHNEDLGKLISQHGVDYKGLLDSINEVRVNSGLLPSEVFTIRTVQDFLNKYRDEIPNGGIDATTEQVGELARTALVDVRYFPLFQNVTPEHFRQVRNWPDMWPLTERQKESIQNILKEPKFRKELLQNFEDGTHMTLDDQYQMLKFMPDLSREDAECVAKKWGPDAVKYAVQYRSTPPELDKVCLRDLANRGAKTFEHNTGLLKSAGEMLDSSDESPQVKDFIGRVILDNVANIHKDDEDPIKLHLKIIERIPANDLGRYLAMATTSEKGKLANRLNGAQFSPEQNAAVDEWSKKDRISTAARFIDSGRANELPVNDLEDILTEHVRDLDNFGYDSRYRDAVAPDRMTAAVGLLPKESIDRMIEDRKAKYNPMTGSRSGSVLGLWKYLNPRGESPSDEQYQSQAEFDPNFINNKFNVDYEMRLNGAKRSIMSGDDLLAIANKTSVNPELMMQVLTHPNLTPAAYYVVHRENVNSPEYENIFDGMGEFPKRVVKFKSILDGTHGNRTDVRVGSTALRHLRDHLDERAAEGVASLRPEDLPKGKTFNTLTRAVTDKKGNVQHVLDWNPLRDNRAGGNLTSDRVREAIDAMPIKPVMMRKARDPWTGMQNHTSQGTDVMQFMPTPETMQKIRDAGLYTAFAEMSLDHMRDGTNHPTAPFHLGWVRYSLDRKSKEVFIDEIQSDLHTSFRRLMKEPDNKLKEQMQSVMDILFGKSHPSEVMHEGFHQHLRDNGMVGYKIHIHGVKSKAHMSLQDPDKPVPAHFKEGYEAIPKKMGYTPAKYGDLSIETGDGDRKARQLDGMPTHGSKVVKFEEMLFELSKGEW
jgi:hypothetical protein